MIYLQKGWLEDPLPPGEYLISVITEIELLSFAGLDDAQRSWLQRLIDDLEVVEIDWAVNLPGLRCQTLKLLAAR